MSIPPGYMAYVYRGPRSGRRLGPLHRVHGRLCYWMRPEAYRVEYLRRQAGKVLDALEPHIPALWGFNQPMHPLWARWAKETP